MSNETAAWICSQVYFTITLTYSMINITRAVSRQEHSQSILRHKVLRGSNSLSSSMKTTTFFDDGRASFEWVWDEVRNVLDINHWVGPSRPRPGRINPIRLAHNRANSPVYHNFEGKPEAGKLALAMTRNRLSKSRCFKISLATHPWRLHCRETSGSWYREFK